MRRVLARPPSFGARPGDATHCQRMASVSIGAAHGDGVGNGRRLLQAFSRKRERTVVAAFDINLLPYPEITQFVRPDVQLLLEGVSVCRRRDSRSAAFFWSLF